MPTPLTPWGAKALELLADGRWHSRAELLDAMTPLIPPGIAFRYNEAERNRKRSNGPGGRTRGDDSTSIEVGARVIAARQLRDFVRTRGQELQRAERAVVDGVDSFRLASAQSKAS